MKKLIQGLVLVLLLGCAVQVKAQQTKVQYYYYPSSNVYYNPQTNEYWYKDTTTTSWVTVKTLPANVTVSDNDKQVVYYNGTDPWKNNTADQKKYKVKRGGKKIKQKND
ncbi:hypothetical protein FW778_20320 [Ginsengibacter hankyongi]|uniref:WW domain-containing protein n=1 Tax=Ginsengibacter hankyongi TaxID=2607284 RepID=A0A5J5IEY6_9BACT|nr:hypothetical protein [Ginsengibacter hankyongi]KAA9035897.1 hypothetical protein FW778_20320 [Ginsengibacter hankyongi]